MQQTGGELCYEWQTTGMPSSHYVWWDQKAEGGLKVALPCGYVIDGLQATRIFRDVVADDADLLSPIRRGAIPVSRRIYTNG
jgi:hypothetical protein